MIRVLIADDHPIVREGLKHIMDACRDIQVVAEAGNADETLAVCRGGKVDVVLLDITMPGPGFIQLIKQVHAAAPTVRILMLSVHPEEHFAHRAIQAGAHGYLTKDQSTEALALAIRRVYSGKKYISPSLAEELALHLIRGEKNRHEGLTNREYEVFVELGAGQTVEEIAIKLTLSPKSVRTYRARIVEKLGLRNTTQLIMHAVRRGLVPMGP